MFRWQVQRRRAPTGNGEWRRETTQVELHRLRLQLFDGKFIRDGYFAFIIDLIELKVSQIKYVRPFWTSFPIITFTSRDLFLSNNLLIINHIFSPARICSNVCLLGLPSSVRRVGRTFVGLYVPRRCVDLHPLLPTHHLCRQLHGLQPVRRHSARGI